MRRLLVLEVNELAPRVVDWWCDRRPESPLARLVTSGTYVSTVLEESLPRDLYPSQSWASLGTGVPWEKHGIFWYGDPKPREFPFYWQAAADAGRTVGLIGVLHSSPVAGRCDSEPFRFLVPDYFAVDEPVRPDGLAALARFNARLSAESARIAAVALSPEDLPGVAGLVRHGLTPSTAGRLARMVTEIAAGRWSKERFRSAQALLMGDVFARQVRGQDPDLAVYFCNHIASAQHRYWAATFPEDWPSPPYTPEWRNKHADEIPFALSYLDLLVARLQRLAADTGRELVITSSMGQKADLELATGDRYQAVIRDPAAFLAACGIGAAEVRGAMVPQLTLHFGDSASTAAAEAALVAVLGSAARSTMTADTTLTLTYQFECDADSLLFDGRRIEPSAIGCSIETIDDHRSGRHDPTGVLISSETHALPPTVDAFTVAPWLLEQLDVEPLGHHRELP